MSQQSRPKTKAKLNPRASELKKRNELVKEGLEDDVSALTVGGGRVKGHGRANDTACPTAYEVYFDPISLKFWKRATGKNPQVWPENSERALLDVAHGFYWSNRDYVCWMLAASRLHGRETKMFFTRIEPIAEGTDGAEDYLHGLLERELSKLRLSDADTLTAITGSKTKRVWLHKSDRLSFGISPRKPQGNAIEMPPDCLNPFPFEVDKKKNPQLFALAKRAADLVAKIKPLLLTNPKMDSEVVWGLALEEFLSPEEFDKSMDSVVSLSTEGKVRMPHEEGLNTLTREALLAKDIEQAHYEGFESLAPPSLRRIKGAAIRQLKVGAKNKDAKLNAITREVFPIAAELFPDEFKNAIDIDVDGVKLTAAFKRRAEKPKNGKRDKPSDEQYRTIIRLMRAWRDSIRHVRFRGIEANGFVASGGGIEYQAADATASYIRTNRFWPVLDFTEKSPDHD